MKMPDHLDAAMLAPCGMNCAVCYQHVGTPRRGKPCPGCLQGDEGKTGHCHSCKIKGCAREKGHARCFACEGFPCKRVKSLEKSYQNRYQTSLIENSNTAKSKGVPAFLAQDRVKWMCTKCGGAFSLHDGVCSECGQAKPRNLEDTSMKKRAIFVILDEFADYEVGHLASALQGRILDKTAGYEVKTVSLTKAPVKTIGGLTVLPDYDLEDCPSDFAALVLVGGNSWRTESAKQITPLLDRALAENKIVGAICDATVLPGMNGHLNGRKHTANTLESLMEGAGSGYSGKESYVQEQAVRDGNLITANGTAGLEFTREMLLALEAYPADYVESNYRFFKAGFVEALKNRDA